MSEKTVKSRRTPEWWEIREMESNGCRCDDWSGLAISDDTSLSSLRNVTFVGDVSLGALGPDAGDIIENCRIEECTVGDHVEIRNVGDRLLNCIIEDGVHIINTHSIVFEQETRCGVGTEVEVLDETGSRPVVIYPGLSAQIALLMAREPRWAAHHLMPILSEWLLTYSAPNHIGEGARIEGCGPLTNVSIGREIKVVGARSLMNGTLVNNAAPGRALTYVGSGVDAENFVLEDGRLDSGAIIRNCYIGQGATIEKGFSAHDSLFFANCSMENGEACALFAGPYSVSMHKSTLLIGCQTSFLNAGSGSNQSNHMYKLGPVHWGILERGVKTSSASYLMLGAKIGAFSLLMGQHKTHPDSSQFPFSYLFGDDRGATVVVPAVMLRSCGLMRDEQKWPNRDRRLKRKLPLHDRIVFDVLNPLTVDRMLWASEIIDGLLARPADDDRYIRYRGMKFTRASLERARLLYELAIYKYLSIKTPKGIPDGDATELIDEWVDIAGLPVQRQTLKRVMECNSIRDIEQLFTEAFESYADKEKLWIAARFPRRWHKHPEIIAEYARDFDKMIEEDRTRYLDDLKAQNDMLAL